jgi:hypothetical protein
MCRDVFVLISHPLQNIFNIRVIITVYSKIWCLCGNAAALVLRFRIS